MVRGKGIEKMFGQYIDPKTAWKKRNPDKVSAQNKRYFQRHKEAIYEKRRQTAKLKREEERSRLF